MTHEQPQRMNPLGLVLFLRHLPLQAIQPVVRLLGGRFDRCQPGNDLHMPLVLFLLLALDVIYTGFNVPDLCEQYTILLLPWFYLRLKPVGCSLAAAVLRRKSAFGHKNSALHRMQNAGFIGVEENRL